MPCGCKVPSSGSRTIVLNNPRTGKKIAEITIPQTKIRKTALLPGLTRIVKDETMRRLKIPRRIKI